MPISKPTTPWTFATIAWIAVIFFSSTSKAAQWCEQIYSAFFRSTYRGANDWLHLLADKGFHVGLFLVLAILLWQTIPDISWKIALILLFGLTIGSCSEFLQSFFPDRDPALRDVLINLGGTIAGVVVCGVPLIFASFKKSQIVNRRQR
jgi:VanZ family protein